MQNNKIISIIVPIYNRGTFLPRCITSIINQSYPHLDIILVNDGSSDDSLDICNQYAQNDKRIRVISIPNSGVSIARNTGIQYAKGDFIQFVDSDDMIKPHMCQILMEEQQKNDADLVICGFDNTDTNGKHLFYESTDKPVYVLNEFYAKFGLLLQQNLLRSPVNKLYKKRIIDAHKLTFNSDFSIAEDALFNVIFYPHINSITVIPQPLYICIDHTDNNRLTKKLHDNYFEIQNIFFTALVNLLKEKNAYTQKNKKIIHLQYTQIIIIGLQTLKLNNKDLNMEKIYDSLLFSFFPYTGKKKLTFFFKSLSYAKKVSATAYVQNNHKIVKKLYGIAKVIFWQCIEFSYTIFKFTKSNINLILE